MGAAVQLMGIIRTLLDPENMLASVNKSEKTDFLNHFYKHCMHGEPYLRSKIIIIYYPTRFMVHTIHNLKYLTT